MREVLAAIARLSASAPWSGTQKELAAECGMPFRSCVRHIKSLRDAGLIQVCGGRGRKCLYALASVQIVPERAIAAVGNVIDAITEIPHSKRASDAPGQMYLDFENGYETAGLSNHDQRHSDAVRIANRNYGSQANDCRGRQPICQFVGDDARSVRDSHIRTKVADAGDQVSTGNHREYAKYDDSSRTTDLLRKNVESGPINPIGGASITTSEPFLTAFKPGSVAACLPIRRFKLPPNTKPADMRKGVWIDQFVFERLVKCGLATVDERVFAFAIVRYVLRMEPKTPAALLTFILNGGKRKDPWRSDVTADDLTWARQMIRDLDYPGARERQESKRETELTRSNDREETKRRFKALWPDIFKGVDVK